MVQYKFVPVYNNARTIRLAMSHITRARRAGVDYEAIDLGKLYKDKRGVCGVCRQVVPFDTFTVDHIRPLSKGGVHLRWNVQIAHLGCNAVKGRKLGPGFHG